MPDRSARLPYARTPRPAWREPVDTVPSDAIPSAEVQARILATLQSGPLHKWQLHETLGINDVRLLKELTRLRKAGRVVAFSARSRERRWKVVA